MASRNCAAPDALAACVREAFTVSNMPARFSRLRPLLRQRIAGIYVPRQSHGRVEESAQKTSFFEPFPPGYAKAVDALHHRRRLDGLKPKAAWGHMRPHIRTNPIPAFRRIPD